MKRLKISKAFSLIEILLVTILLAVIAGLTIPNFAATFNSFELSRSVKEFAYVMRYAQSRAVSRGEAVRLEFSDLFDGYWLSEQADVDEEPGPSDFTRVSGRWGRVFHFAKGLELEFESESEEEFIEFFPDGQISKVAVQICSPKKCMMVSTKEQRGYVRILEEIKG